MSGLYLIGIAVLWVWLTSMLLWFGWRKVLRKRKGNTVQKILVSLIILTWLVASLWYGGVRKVYYDWRVDKMCAVDGGVKVFEKVSLSEEKFDKYGNIGISSKRNAKASDEYYFESEDVYLRKRNPKIIRSITKIIRRRDGKILGESIRYSRSGGDLPGPWHPSSYNCPQIRNAEGKLEVSIFMKGIK